MTTKRVTISTKPTPGHADTWVLEGNGVLPVSSTPRAELYTARLTIDVTPELRGRIKVQAFQKGMTVAELLRGLLDRKFPYDNGVTSR